MGVCIFGGDGKGVVDFVFKYLCLELVNIFVFFDFNVFKFVCMVDVILNMIKIFSFVYLILMDVRVI